MKTKIILLLILVGCTKKNTTPSNPVDTRVTIYVSYSFWKYQPYVLQFWDNARTYHFNKGYKMDLTIERKGNYIIFDGHDSLYVKKAKDYDSLYIKITDSRVGQAPQINYKGKGDFQHFYAEL